MFFNDGRKHLLAEFSDKEFNMRRTMHDRLQVFNNWSTLEIRDLRLQDSGIYTERIYLWHDGEVRDFSYNLTVLGGDSPLQVTAYVGETATLTPDLPYEYYKVSWTTFVKGKTILVAEWSQKEYNENPYFQNRLDGYELTLEIRDLRLQDSGIYTERIIFLEDGEVRDFSYNLTVLGGDSPLQVTAYVGETATLTPDLPYEYYLVSWTTFVKGKTILVAEWSQKEYNENPYFQNRLDGYELTLEIRELIVCAPSLASAT
ncbi:uncharacterized protein LOC121397224 isoform X2 [Xenopus laevis]|uniref:Uncharacterized protein LOC121397224 isoform X2 n=1 Tax=Xenopus laevis TaxID=8355 RepID=A0A8J1LKF0_XENLA|nr:uncharacterized protein LOC121397224 isoform X2 [Xenopus laevis]